MTHVERLVKIYLDSQERLLKEIKKREQWGRSTWHQQDMVRLIDAELKKLNLESYAWAKEAIEAAYMRSAKLAWMEAKTGNSKAFASFGGLHKKAVALLAHNTQDYLNITNNLIARQAKDTVRKVGVEVTAKKFAETLTWKETAKLMEQRLAEEGFYTVPWRNGKGNMRLDSYAELVARTTTAEATNTGAINQAEAMGQYLLKMTAHNTTCKVCASRQGRVYRTKDFPDGDPRQQFPHISEGLPRWPTYKTVHPNCVHRVLPFVWSQKTPEEQQAALKDAKAPFNHDPRGEAERRRYEDAQRKNAERLRDRKQWERYRDVLGRENVPKTLSAFRQMKKSGNENWKEMTSDYRHALRIMRKDDILESKYFRSLPTTGKPFSLKDLVRDDGTVKQRRLYGEDGKPLKDIDTSDHNLPKYHPMGAHAHDWENGKRGLTRPLTEREKRQNKDILERGEDE